MKEKLTVFLHLPKTGGSTLFNLVSRHFLNDEKIIHMPPQQLLKNFSSLSVDQKSKIRLLAGHYFFGVHHLINEQAEYFTMLRDPVDRTISLYYFLSASTAPWHSHVKNMSLREFIESGEEANAQTILISGSLENPSVEKAMYNIKQYFPVVGITEYYDESLYFLKNHFGYSNLSYVKVNVTPYRLSVNEVGDDIVELIKQRNHLDIELYQQLKEIFEKKLLSLSVEEKEDLLSFKSSIHQGN